MRAVLPARLIRRLARTALLAWVTVRVAVALLGTIHLSVLGIAFLAGLVLALVWLDIARSGERILYANLAVSPAAISALVVAVTLAVEVLAGAALALLLPGTSTELPI